MGVPNPRIFGPPLPPLGFYYLLFIIFNLFYLFSNYFIRFILFSSPGTAWNYNAASSPIGTIAVNTLTGCPRPIETTGRRGYCQINFDFRDSIHKAPVPLLQMHVAGCYGGDCGL